MTFEQFSGQTDIVVYRGAVSNQKGSSFDPGAVLGNYYRPTYRPNDQPTDGHEGS